MILATEKGTLSALDLLVDFPKFSNQYFLLDPYIMTHPYYQYQRKKGCHQLLNYKRFNKVIEALNLNKIVNIEFYYGQNPNVKNASLAFLFYLMGHFEKVTRNDRFKIIKMEDKNQAMALVTNHESGYSRIQMKAWDAKNRSY